MLINNLAGLHGETSWVSTMHGVSWVQKWQVLSHLQNQISSLSQCERSYGIQSIGQRFQVASIAKFALGNADATEYVEKLISGAAASQPHPQHKKD